MVRDAGCRNGDGFWRWGWRWSWGGADGWKGEMETNGDEIMLSMS